MKETIKKPRKRNSGKRTQFPKCTVCRATAQNLEDLEAHFLTHELKYDCQICHDRFRCPYQCSLHMSEHDCKDFTCCLCSYTTSKKMHLLRHVNNTHLKRYIYHCEVCGQGYNCKSDITDHKLMHDGVKRHVCVVCEKKFSLKSCLVRHQVACHSVASIGAQNENQCSICKKVFRKKSTLQDHVHDTHDLKRHMCDKCGKCFPRNSHLILHYRTHTGVKPFACNSCEKCFSSKVLLRLHVRVHTGEKPFACQYCEKSFSQRGYLRKHIRIHTGEKPFACKYCEKSFKQATQLRRHTRVHTGETPYICQFCSRGYITRDGFISHLRYCNAVKLEDTTQKPTSMTDT